MNNLKLHEGINGLKSLGAPIVDHPSFLPSLSLKELFFESTHCITGVEELERTHSSTF